MNILYDYQIFTIQKYGGISRYFSELISRFDQTNYKTRTSLYLSNNAYITNQIQTGVKQFFPNTKFRGKDRILDFVNKQKSQFDLKYFNFDLFHPTYYNTYFLKNLNNKPFVATFYDLIHEKFSNQFPELSLRKELFLQKRIILEKAKRIIAISETTKNDIINFYKISGENIDVVYLANSINKTFDVSDSLFNKYEYILYVGNRDGYKNFLSYLESIRELLISNNLRLVCAGGGNFSSDELSFINKLNLNKYIIFEKIENDTKLSTLYQNALFFVFPSLYEGFGIPILEAFANNCPALLSNTGSLPEIGSDSALYFNPSCFNSMFEMTSKMIRDVQLRNTLRLKGLMREKSFNWDLTFKETIEVYNRALRS